LYGGAVGFGEASFGLVVGNESNPSHGLLAERSFNGALLARENRTRIEPL
jgi:hypothetical protein